MENSYKTVVVTGGGGGIGEALCLKLKSEGSQNIIVADLNLESAQKVADKLGGNGIAIQCDCGDDLSIKNLIEKTEKEIGPIDMFIINAGILLIGDPMTTTDKDWDLTWRINVMQGIYVSRYLIPKMLQRKKGTIVVTASAVGLLPKTGVLAYTLSKHAAVSLAEWLHITYSSQNIKVFCICPMFVDTGLIKGLHNSLVQEFGGVIQPSKVADTLFESIKENKFFAFPHKEVEIVAKQKASNPNAWLKYVAKREENISKSSKL